MRPAVAQRQLFFRQIWTLGLLLGGALSGVAGESRFYRVEPGDSLALVSLRLYGSSRMWRRIARLNHLASPDAIVPGERLIVLPGRLSRERGRDLVVAFWKKKLERKEPFPDWDNSDPLPREPASPAEVVFSSLDDSHRKFQKGRELFEKGEIRAALALFRGSRIEAPSFLPPWLYEIRSLRLLGDARGAARTIRDVLEGHPELAALPLLQLGERK